MVSCISRDLSGWYIENSLTTLGHKGFSEENTRLWNTGVESDKGIAEIVRENYLTIQMCLLYQAPSTS